MAFEGRYRDTQKGGFGGSSSSSSPIDDGATTALRQLDQELVKFQGCIDSIGTPLDTQENRADIKRLRGVIKSKVTTIKSSLKETKKTSQNKIMLDRQTAQLDSQITKFQKLLEMDKAAVKQHPVPTNSGSPVENGSRDDNPSPVQSMAMSQMQRMGGLEEREMEAQELRQLETDIVDLRDIHQEMAHMVDEQGQDISNIEKNVSKAAVRVEAGTKQTKVAVELKKKNIRLKLITAAIIIAAVVAVLIVLAILLAVFIPRGDS